VTAEDSLTQGKITRSPLDTLIKQELLKLATVCEEVANNIEDRRPSA